MSPQERKNLVILTVMDSTQRYIFKFISLPDKASYEQFFFHIFDLILHVVDYLISRTIPKVAKFNHTWPISKLDFLENEVSHGKIVFYVFDLLLHVESPCCW